MVLPTSAISSPPRERSVGTRALAHPRVLRRDVSDARTPLLNNAMHWLEGTGWGVLYGVARREPGQGVAFGLSVWGASLLELPAMQLAPPIWETPPSGIAPDVGFHLVYGVATAQVLRALTRRED